jgi:hypothetical protein
MVTGPVQLSEAVRFCGTAGTKKHSTVIFAGGFVNVGAIISFTVMVCAQVAALPHKSVARYVRAMVKRLAQIPAVVISPTNTTVTAPPQRSEAVTEAGAAAGTSLAQETTRFAGQLMLGAVTSFTVIV